MAKRSTGLSKPRKTHSHKTKKRLAAKMAALEAQKAKKTNKYKIVADPIISNSR